MKKFLALFLIIVVGLVVLGGCASSERENPSDLPTPPSSELSNQPEDPELNEPSETEPSETTPGPSNPPDEQPTGIIAMTSHIGTSFMADIFSINPETGERLKIANLAFPTSGKDDGEPILFIQPVDEANSSNVVEWVSADFSKIAATKIYTNDMSSHAGWFDTDGVFFDVTEALGLQATSDFADPVHYVAIGFTEDNYFAYYSATDKIFERTYYYVPLDNLTQEAIQAGNPFAETMPVIRDGSDYYYFTDWLDDTHYLADFCEDSCWHKIQSVIIESGTGEVNEYIPGESRFNWNGVVSPDGTQIAFLSTPRQGTGSPQLHVMSIDGGDPVAVDIELEFAYVPKALKPSYAQYPTAGAGEGCTTLLDWR